MKAWIVENKRIDGEQEIVFADNYKEAKVKATHTDLYEYHDDYIRLRVRRYPEMDGADELSHIEYTYKLWQSGWLCDESYPSLKYYDEYEDEQEARSAFMNWYNRWYRQTW